MLRMASSRGISGKIKEMPEDFVVEEIAKNGKVLTLNERVSSDAVGMHASQAGKFSVFVMQKKDWNTIQALKVLAKKAGRGIKSTAFAGTKDRASVSTQICSIFGARADRLATLHVKDIAINGAWQSDTGVELGDLLGNRFTLTIKESDATQSSIHAIEKELNGLFPNYFGEQRFGYRGNNFEIGLAIIKGEFEKAAMEFLTNTNNERNLDSIEARERLSKELDFKAALDYFPQYLKYERIVLEYLAKYPTDYANAIRRLPRQLSLMMVHSVEGYIFNEEVEARLGVHEIKPGSDDLFCNPDMHGFPNLSTIKNAKEAKHEHASFLVGNIIGYDSEALNEAEKEILERMNITKEMFKIQSMPELSCRGNYRVLFAPYTGFSSHVSDNSAVLSFSLPAGSYATVLLNEFVRD